MLRYLLDTNMCGRAMRVGPQARLAQKFARHQDQLCISSIVLAELLYGAENSNDPARNRTEVAQLVGRLNAVLDFDAAAAAIYGLLRFELKRRPIGPLDTLIAAHARSRGLIVVTTNVKEFARVPGLMVETWG